MDAEPATTAGPGGMVLLTGVVLSALGAIAFGLKSVVVKVLYEHGVDAVTQVMWRMALALPLFVLMAWWSGRGKPALSRMELAHAALLGFLGYYLASYLDMASINYISISLERLIFYLNPTLVVLLAWLVQGRRPLLGQVVGIAVSYAGVLLMIDADTATDSRRLAWGVGLVSVAALSYACYIVLSAGLSQRMGAIRLTGWASMFASMLCVTQFVILRPVQTVFTVEPAVLWLSLLNATLGTAVPVAMVMVAISRIGPALTAQVGLVGAVFTVVTEPIFLGTSISAMAGAGAALVVVGILGSMRAGQQPRQRTALLPSSSPAAVPHLGCTAKPGS